MALLGTNAITRLGTATLNVASTTAGQALYTVPATIEGGTALTGCALTHFVVRSASVALSSAQFSIGYDTTAYADVVATTLTTAITGSTVYSVLSAKAGARVGTAGGVVYAMFSVGQTTATTNTCKVDSFGMLW